MYKYKREYLLQELKKSHVIISDSVMRKYFGVTWCEYKKNGL